MRPKLLRTFGWRVESVLAKDWYENQRQELDRLLAALRCSQEVPAENHANEFEESDSQDEVGSIVGQSTDPVAMPEIAAADELELSNAAIGEAPAKTGSKNDRTDVTANLVSGPVVSSRRFEFREGTSSKFWEIILNGQQHTVRFGRIGTNGQSQTKSFSSVSAAQNDADRLIAEKMRKGYREIADR